MKLLLAAAVVAGLLWLAMRRQAPRPVRLPHFEDDTDWLAEFLLV